MFRRKLGAFTLVELLVVIGIIALLISILLPVLNKAKRVAERTKCLANQKQIATAWLMYASDNKGWLTNSDTHLMATDPAARNPRNRPWMLPAVLGDVTLPDGRVVKGNSEDAVRYGALWIGSIVKSAKVWKCPSDDGPHIRTYALNCYLNGEYFGGNDSLPVYKLSDVKYASNTFVSIDEYDLRKDSLDFYNIGSYGVHSYLSDDWIDAPGNWHDAGAVLSFADGHAEYHKWVDRRTIASHDFGYGGIQGGTGNQDLYWLELHKGDYEKIKEGRR